MSHLIVSGPSAKKDVASPGLESCTTTVTVQGTRPNLHTTLGTIGGRACGAWLMSLRCQGLRGFLSSVPLHSFRDDCDGEAEEEGDAEEIH
jgi:hypothetical protein